ncbi:hypothetical protein CJ030_MR2G019239 [Morella rubra]|uniref:Uncharacterized protein n=1 Tax=Morella rubra TaxID=262757 RepID=A0A6A1WGA4_9ROSI|nr:hypothetical protein CJ030_MR2G019238 [Morella rubra]KAB1224251.1 hypothetical protein CJ030_MR2G019239 [Morella rubra]
MCPSSSDAINTRPTKAALESHGNKGILARSLQTMTMREFQLSELQDVSPDEEFSCLKRLHLIISPFKTRAVMEWWIKSAVIDVSWQECSVLYQEFHCFLPSFFNSL